VLFAHAPPSQRKWTEFYSRLLLLWFFEGAEDEAGLFAGGVWLQIYCGYGGFYGHWIPFELQLWSYDHSIKWNQEKLNLAQQNCLNKQKENWWQIPLVPNSRR
jgi:hypothetical protein